MRSYSTDLRRRVIDLIQENELPQPEIAEHFSVSLSFVEKLWNRFRQTGKYEALAHGGGRERMLKNDEQLIRSAVAEQPDLTLAELSAQVAAKTNQPPVALDVMSDELRRLGLPRKKR